MAAQVGNEVAHARTAEEKTAIAESFMSTDFAFSEDERRMLRTPGFCFWNYAVWDSTSLYTRSSDAISNTNTLQVLEISFRRLTLPSAPLTDRPGQSSWAAGAHVRGAELTCHVLGPPRQFSPVPMRRVRCLQG